VEWFLLKCMLHRFEPPQSQDRGLSTYKVVENLFCHQDLVLFCWIEAILREFFPFLFSSLLEFTACSITVLSLSSIGHKAVGKQTMLGVRARLVSRKLNFQSYLTEVVEMVIR